MLENNGKLWKGLGIPNDLMPCVQFYLLINMSNICFNKKI